jgi:hypothetical protein
MASARPRLPGAGLVIAVFLAALVVPGLGLALGFGRAMVSESEMRELAAWPAWPRTVDGLKAWPSAFQAYVEDHFALRAELIDWRSRALWRVFGTAGFDTAIVGKDGWLFYAEDGSLEDWIQAAPFPEAELADWTDALLRRRAFLARRGIPYLFVIAPDKQMVYPEYMPDALHRLRQEYRVDQLMTYMRRAAPDFAFLDLRDALRPAKGGELLYHRFDTHWNDRGALVAYQAIARALQQWFPTLKALERGDFTTDTSVSSGDKTTMLGLVDEGKQRMPGLVLKRGAGFHVVAPRRPDPYGEDPILIIEHEDQSLPRAIVYRDSFGARLIPYLSEHFSHVEYYWQNELDYEEIERQRPDVVIQVFTARHFHTFGPYPPEIPR